MKKFTVRLLGKPGYPYGQRTILSSHEIKGESESEITAYLLANKVYNVCDDFLVLEHR